METNRVETRLFECDPELAEKFMKFHHKNPVVYNNFKKYSYELLDAGTKRSSHWLILNRVRWDGLVSTSGNRYKVSNDFIALYARLLILECPEFEGFFSLKQMKAKRAAGAGE